MAKYRLLVVEDDEDIAQLVAYTADIVGFETKFSSGFKVKDLYDDFQPDVIVLDIQMPEVDGYQFLQFLKTRNSHAHIIVLSGNSDFHKIMVETVGSGSAMVIEANIPKPFRVNELQQILRKVSASLSGAQLRKQG